ncbi:MAG: LytTR family DNA-binding domain-containing protein [Gemmatimonadales bacterium]
MVNSARIREIEPLFNGEHSLVLTTGARVTLSRSYRDRFFGRMGSGR